MKHILRIAFAVLALLALTGSHAADARTYTQAELDQMIAPVALYPDPLLSQVLMASTYPLEVVEAARWTHDHPGLRGDAATRAVQNQDWDPSVKSLVAFPQVLERMNENLDWTRALGDAFLAQEPQVMDSVQELRRRAQAASNLQSDGRIRVEPQGDYIALAPVSPGYFYVPYYDPLVVYGPWWWPAYPPVGWAPWPGYARIHRPGISLAFWWGPPVGLAANFFFGGCDWHRRSVEVVNVHAYYYHRPPASAGDGRGHWQHDPRHRRNVAYATPELGRRFGAAQRGASPAPATTAAPAHAHSAEAAASRSSAQTHAGSRESAQQRPLAHPGARAHSELRPATAGKPAPQVQARPPAARTVQPQVRTIPHGRRPPQAHGRPPAREAAPRPPGNGVAGDSPQHARHGHRAEQHS